MVLEDFGLACRYLDYSRNDTIIADGITENRRALMTKIDIKKELGKFYNPGAKDVTLTDIPKMNFIMVDGQGAPESEQFQQSVEALYSIAYAIKMAKKKTDGTDYAVLPLEGLWWAADMSAFDPQKSDRSKWQWTLMIMQPDFVTAADFAGARQASMKKKANPDISEVRFESFKEGKSAQIMHIGPFSAEGENVRRIHDRIAEIGGTLSGKHHEVYLSDFRRVSPDKMRTVLRQPYK